jgi:uncharacterized integral membrane protein (TIGR00698 family)
LYNIYLNIFQKYASGIFVAIIIALAAQFISYNYQAPAMLMALLIGMVLHFLGEEGRCVEGLDFTSKYILRLGIILLGTRISFELILSLDLYIIFVISCAVFLTILFSILILKSFGFDWKFGVLLGGSVAICGASAAMAIAAVLPKDKKSEQNLTFVVLGVTMLSTLAMIFYPILTNWLNMDDKNAGIFLGATIHDVAQVIGAGFSVSDLTGDTATLIKLFRVTLLFPVVLIISFYVKKFQLQKNNSTKTPFVPGFITLFIFCVILNSLGIIPNNIIIFFSELSKFCLLAAIAAVGTKTNLQNLKVIGFTPAFLIIANSLFLLIFILVSI